MLLILGHLVGAVLSIISSLDIIALTILRGIFLFQFDTSLEEDVDLVSGNATLASGVSSLYHYTVEPPLKDPPRKGQHLNIEH